MPTKKPRGEELTPEQQRANQALHQRDCGSSMSIGVSSGVASTKTASVCGKKASAIWSWNSIVPCTTSECASRPGNQWFNRDKLKSFCLLGYSESSCHYSQQHPFFCWPL